MKRALRHPFVKLGLALALITPAVTSPPSPAAATHSSDTSTGNFNLVGKATFSRFPCESTGATQCIALLKGGWRGGFAGTRGLNAFDVHVETDPADMATGGELGTNTSRMHSLFYTYDPICTPTFDAAGVAEGYAVRGSGSAVATSARQEVTGSTYTHASSGVTEEIKEVHLNFTFGWARWFTGVAVTYNSVELSAKIPSRTELVTLFEGSEILGGGSFVVEDPGYDTGVPGCDAPLTGMEARTDLLLPVDHPSA